MKSICKYSLCIFLLFSQSIIGQNNYNFNQFFDETEQLIKKPFYWDFNDWGKVGLAAASTFLIMQFDDNIRDEFQRVNFNKKSSLIESGRVWGEVYTTAIIGSVFAISGLTSDDSNNKKIAFEIIQSAIYTGIITQSLKVLFGRSRPYNNNGETSFHSINKFDDDHWSLPSGHTSLAFSLSTVLSENVESDLLKALCYLPAVLTAYSRVVQDYHWTSDVVLGAAIGYFIGKWVTAKHDENKIQISYSAQSLVISIPLN